MSRILDQSHWQKLTGGAPHAPEPISGEEILAEGRFTIELGAGFRASLVLAFMRRGVSLWDAAELAEGYVEQARARFDAIVSDTLDEIGFCIEDSIHHYLDETLAVFFAEHEPHVDRRDAKIHRSKTGPTRMPVASC